MDRGDDVFVAGVQEVRDNVGPLAGADAGDSSDRRQAVMDRAILAFVTR